MRHGIPGWCLGLATGLAGGLLAPDGAAAAPPAPPARPNLILVTLDTTRADHLGAYGYGRPTSPAIDRLAADAVLYTNATTTSTWTLPSHASLFTGRFPKSHGARLDRQGRLSLAQAVSGPAAIVGLRARPLTADQPTLAGILRDAGYATAAVVGGPWMKRLFGLGAGFQHYDDAEITEVAGRLARQVTDAAIAWLDGHAGERFFLFLNYYDPHGPYSDPDWLAQEFLPPGQYVFPEPENPSLEYVRATYDGEIRYMDQHLGRLLDHLRARGLYDAAWIVVTADHGELLGEEGRRGHGLSLYQGELRIPLLVKPPRGSAPPGREDQRIQLTDLLPMLLARLGLPPPPGVQGRAEPEERPPTFAEVSPLATALSGWRAWFGGPFKLLWSSRGEHELYQVAADPEETRDLAGKEATRLGALVAELEAFYAALPEPAPQGPGEELQVDEQTRRTLEALGYLE